MSSVVISGDTSGAITLAAPAVAGTNTINLPAAAGTVMVSGNMPAFSAYMSASSTSTTAGVYTKLPFNTKIFDTNTCFNTSTYEFTPTVAGYYQVSILTRVADAGSLSTDLELRLYKNGSAIAAQYTTVPAGGVNWGLTFSTLIYMNGTDYISIYGLGGARAGVWYGGSGASGSFFSAAMVRGA